MARILLTGGTGFVGNALLRHLVARGDDVILLGGSRSTGATLPTLAIDLLNARPSEIARALTGAAADICFHAAWYTNHADYLTADINRAWRDATIRLARAFWDAGGRRFVGLGTCFEYDIFSGTGLLSEATSPVGAHTLYGRCKLDALNALQTVADRDEASFAWARLFFIYGPADRTNRLIPHIIQSLADGVVAKARYGGLRRDYIHVDDLAALLGELANADAQGIVNCASGKATTIADIFRIAADIMRRPDLVTVNADIGDEPPLIEADMRKFRSGIGPVISRPLRSGLTDLALGHTR